MSPVLDESIVGQWYIPRTDEFTQCVVGEDESPALSGTAAACPQILKIHSPSFSQQVWISDKPGERLLFPKRFVFLQARNLNIYLAGFDADNVFRSWGQARTCRDEYWTELKYQALI